VFACAVLLAVHALVAWRAAASHSPTYDEPLHVVAAWEQWHGSGGADFRLDPENPPLWKWWAGLPLRREALADPPTAGEMARVAKDIGDPAPVVVPALFRSLGTDADAMVARARAMMLVLALATAALVAAWAGRVGGPIAAVVAVAAFALDPNWLAHGPLVKNDVALAGVMLALAMAVWSAGRRLTWRNAAAIALLCAAAVTT
jgi:hypothetical protein